jgi:hypothetical protein
MENPLDFVDRSKRTSSAVWGSKYQILNVNVITGHNPLRIECQLRSVVNPSQEEFLEIEEYAYQDYTNDKRAIVYNISMTIQGEHFQAVDLSQETCLEYLATGNTGQLDSWKMINDRSS